MSRPVRAQLLHGFVRFFDAQIGKSTPSMPAAAASCAKPFEAVAQHRIEIAEQQQAESRIRLRISRTISRMPGERGARPQRALGARWITGPSAIGSENGTPSSIRSAPPRSSASTSGTVASGVGSPAVR